MLTQEQLDHVRIIEAPAEGATAAAPRTAGLEHTNAKYICFLDSDDSYQPGAVGRWVKIAEKRHSDMVIPWLKHSNGRTDITPVIRPGRTSNLDPIADRLVYRASVFGLQRVETVRRLGAEFDFGTSTGEDQAFVMRLYAGAARIDYAPGEPTYVMHADATDRVSQTPSRFARSSNRQYESWTNRGSREPRLSCAGHSSSKWFASMCSKQCRLI